MPEVPVGLEVLDAEGKRLARFHYAENFTIRKAGQYTLEATIEPPPLRRHGERQEGAPLAEGAQVEFRQVRLEPS